MAVNDWGDLFQSAGKQYGVDPLLLRAIATRESGGDAEAISPQGAMGPMQLMPDTAKALGVSDPTDPKQAIPAAARLLAENAKQFGSPENAVLAYHGGTDQRNWGPKTKAYLAKVSDTFQQLKSGSPMAQSQAQDPFSVAFGDAAPAAAKAAPAADAFSLAFGDTDSAPKPSTAAPAPQAPPKTSLPPRFDKGIGVALSMGLPFFKDVSAGGAALQDVTENALAGKNGMSIGNAYRARMDELNQTQAQFEATHPRAGKYGWLLGLAAGGEGAAEEAAAKVPKTLGDLMKGGARVGATTGAIYGAGTPAQDGSITGRLENIGIGAGTGAVTGLATPLAGRGVTMLGRGAGNLLASAAEKTGFIPHNAQQEAQNMLVSALDRDSVAPSTVTGELSSGKPLTVMDVAGSNTRRLGRKLVTAQGEAGEGVSKFLNERAADQSGRVLGDIGQHLSNNTDVYGLAAQMTQSRSASAQPLYERAFQGGSIAPLEDQLRSELVTATGAKGSLAKQIKTIEENNPGALAARGAAGAETRAKYLDLRKQLEQAEADRQSAMTIFKKAQADKTADAPGAVWNPRIQQFLNDPIIQSGVKRGMEVQRLEALAEGRSFNPTEYAIVGQDKNGGPVVGTVPNMRLLDAAKRGLDDILEESRDKVTGKLNLDQRGRAVDSVRKSLISELDKLNPDYKAARSAWSGPSQSMSAVNRGGEFLNRDPEQIQQIMAGLSDGDRDFYRVGAARAIQDKANSAGDSADLSKRLFGNNTIRKQIDAVFGPNASEAFGKAMGHEGKMAETRRFVLGGSNTVNKLADFADSGSAVAHEMLEGALAAGPKGAIVHPTLNAIKRGLSSLFEMHPNTAVALGDLLTKTGPEAVPSLNKILAAQAKQAARRNVQRGLAGATNNALAAGAGAKAAGSYRGNR
jgi:hypothetical protein